MNTALILALFIAPFLFSMVNFIDSFIVNKIATVKSAWAFFGLFSFIVSIVIFVWAATTNHSLHLSSEAIRILLLSGVFQVAWVYFYLKALHGVNASSAVPFFQFIGFFAYILGVIFLGESLALSKFIALLVILFGGAMLNYEPGVPFRIRREVGYMLIATLIIAVGLVFFKMGAMSVESFSGSGLSHFFVSSFWMYLGMGISTIIMLILSKSVRTEFVDSVKQRSAIMWKANLLGELSNVLATFAVSYASLKIPVATVTALESIQALYALGLGFIGARLWPRLFPGEALKEGLRHSLVYKVIAIILMIAGGMVLI